MEKAIVLKKQQERYLEDFFLIDAGISKTEPLHGFGPTYRENYVIHIVLAGKGTYLLDGQKLSLGPGAGFVVPTDRSVFYQSDETDPWTYLWIQLNGSKVPVYLEAMGLLQGTFTFKVHNQGVFLKQVLKMLNYDAEKSTYDLHLNADCLAFLGYLADEMYYTDFPVQEKTIPQVVQEAVQYIHRHANKILTVNEIADDLAVNRSYLSRVFHNALGITVKQYMNEIRIFRAAELLIVSDLSMEVIAEQTGFSSAKAFSEIFKKAKKQAPRAYRKGHAKRMHYADFSMASVEKLFEE